MVVGEICNREVVVVGARESVSVAAHLMRDHHVGDLVVVEAGGSAKVPIGIVTDRDLVVELLGEDVEPDKVTVGDILDHELWTARDDEDTLGVLERMREKGVRRMPIVDAEGALVGILTVDDLLDLFAEQLEKMVQLVGREQRREKTTRR